MTWRFEALQELTDHYSLDDQVEDLGVAVWRVYPPNPEAGEEPTAQVVVYELDRSAGEDDHGGDDELARLTFTVPEAGALTVQRASQRGGGNDPTLKLYFLLEQAGRQAPPADQQVTLHVAPGDDADEASFKLELGLRVETGEDEGASGADHLARLDVSGLAPFVPVQDADVDSAREWPPEALTRLEDDDDGWPPRRVTSDTAFPARSECEGDTGPTMRNRRMVYRGQRATAFRVRSAAGDPHLRVTFTPRTRSLPAWGLVYWGRSSRSRFRDRVIEATAEAYRREGEHYRAAACKGAEVFREGGFSAINTYDDKVLTLSMGFAGGRLQRLFDRVRGTPCGRLLAPAFAPHDCFNDDLVFDSDMLTSRNEDRAHRRRVSNRLRWDAAAYEHFVRVTEHPVHGLRWAQSTIQELVEFNAMGGEQDRLDDANQLAQNWRTEHKYLAGLIGVAMYLRHGGDSRIPNPLQDVMWAIDHGEDQPFRMLAIVIHNYVSPMGNDATRRYLLEDRTIFGTRIAQFEEALAGVGVESWRLSDRDNHRAFKAVIPCLGTPVTIDDPHFGERESWVPPQCWDHGSSHPEGHAGLVWRGEHYDFGRRLRPLPRRRRGG